MLILIQGEAKARHLGQVNCVHWELVLLRIFFQLSVRVGILKTPKAVAVCNRVHDESMRL